MAQAALPGCVCNKLSDAESEVAETQTWLDVAYQCGYLSKEQLDELIAKYEIVIAELVTMATNPAKWTRKRIET